MNMPACTLFNEQNKGPSLLSIITWSVLGKQNVQAEKVYSHCCKRHMWRCLNGLNWGANRSLHLCSFQGIARLQRQQQIVDEVKLALKPFFRRGEVSKDDYKLIMKKSVEKVRSYLILKAGTHEGACSCSTLLQHAPGAKLPRLHQRFLAKKYVAQQNFCSRVLLPHIKLVWYEGASSRGKSVARVCFRSKLPRVHWNLLAVTWRVSSRPIKLAYFFHPQQFPCHNRVVSSFSSLVVSFVCTGWGTYPGACVGSVFQEQAPSCVPALKVGGRGGSSINLHCDSQCLNLLRAVLWESQAKLEMVILNSSFIFFFVCGDMLPGRMNENNHIWASWVTVAMVTAINHDSHSSMFWHSKLVTDIYIYIYIYIYMCVCVCLPLA